MHRSGTSSHTREIARYVRNYIDIQAYSLILMWNFPIAMNLETSHQWSQQPVSWERSSITTRILYQQVWFAVDGILTRATKFIKLTLLVILRVETGLWVDQEVLSFMATLMPTTVTTCQKLNALNSLRVSSHLLAIEILHQVVASDCLISLRKVFKENIFLTSTSKSSEFAHKKMLDLITFINSTLYLSSYFE